MTHSTRKLGMMFAAAAWVLVFLTVGLVFSKILDRRDNPNQSVSTLQSGEFSEVVLKRNRHGQYIFDGEINRRKVSFLVDTGATMTTVPGEIQRSLGLTAGPAIQVATASGTATAYMTRLDQLAIGGIEMFDVPAAIISGMGVDKALLGMNVLKHFELVQRGDELIIRQYR
jgi:aspartyl protease family protein